MSTKNFLKEKNKTYYHNSPVTNPLRTEINSGKSVSSYYSLRQKLDKLAFGALGALAIWAFYTALSSLML